MLDPYATGPYLNGWYPGFGEDRILSTMPGHVRSFLAAACDECPDFLEGYLLPALAKPDPYGKIMADLDLALSAMEMDQSGLGDYSNVLHDVGGSDANYFRNIPCTVGEICSEDGIGLGDLIVVPKQKDFRKARQSIVKAAKQQAKAELAAAKATGDKQLIAQEKREYRQDVSAAKHVIQKAKLTAPEKKAIKAEIGHAKRGTHWAFFKDPSGNIIATQAKTMKSGNFFDRAARNIGRGWAKYGNIVILAAGAVLALFTGGASLAAASILAAGNGLYYKKREADKAKAAGSREAHRLQQEAKAADAQTTKQVDDFYAQNQQWFIDNFAVTPDKWARLSLKEKLGLINSGATGQPPAGATPIGSGGTAGGGGGGAPGDPGAPGAAPGGPKIATAGMFDGDMMPMLLVGGIALAAVFGKPVKGGGGKRRRSRRNPSRRRWRVA